ncbi:Aste57867_4920 [Aphanomyces stellatus]|uniref:Aste57867_4920 protein n=1 Tax=Aphanomyces stellatus TaxID=120398 RepID=A0A485KG43_9STRA|nr:hypothetical protein As57867_004907 [Aphanomyces stellatus]VFT82010.1 Aste57867_4920 [Aphanomyces stellatus]
MAIGRNLSAVERRGAYEMLLARSEHGVLPYGPRYLGSGAAHGSPSTMVLPWLTLLHEFKVNLSKCNSGARRMRTADEIEQAIKAVPHDDRQTLRCLEVHSGIKKTTIIRHMKEKKKLKAKSLYASQQDDKAAVCTELPFAWAKRNSFF